MGILFLTVSLLFAVVGNTTVKLSNGFRNFIPSIFSFFLYSICLYFLTLTVRHMEVSIAYAIWSGVTIAATTLIGTLFFHESFSKRKGLSIFFIVIGVLMLKIQG